MSGRRCAGRIALGALVLLAACSSSESGDGSAEAPADEAVGTDTGEPLERYAAHESVNYEDPAHWVCRPDQDDVCDEDLSTTVIAPDGTLTEEPFEAADDPPIDCFYVYPTISQDPTPFSDWDFSPDQEGRVTLNQAARLQSTCRLFAPVYRQRTLVALGAGLSGQELEGEQVDPYADVLDAFRTYMANDNEGRGVVLIGHSQGASMLNRLLREEFDPNPDVRDVLVAAYLAGWNVAVPDGADVGGDFDEIPLCRDADDTACVVTWVTFRADRPPQPGAYFGAPRSGANREADPSDGGLVAACNSPASLAGGSAELHAYFPSGGGSILAGGGDDGGASWVDGGGITTPFVSVPGLATGECASTDGYNYLAVTVHGEPDDPRADDIPGDLTPEWGLHLVDVNLVMGDVVSLVAEQAAAHGG